MEGWIVPSSQIVDVTLYGPFDYGPLPPSVCRSTGPKPRMAEGSSEPLFGTTDVSANVSLEASATKSVVLEGWVGGLHPTQRCKKRSKRQQCVTGWTSERVRAAALATSPSIMVGGEPPLKNH